MTNRFARETEPERWSDQVRHGDDADGAASGSVGPLLGRVREATEPSAAALRRLSLRRDISGAPRRNGSRVWRVAIACTLIMSMGSAVGAALIKWRDIDVRALLGVRPLAMGPGGADGPDGRDGRKTWRAQRPRAWLGKRESAPEGAIVQPPVVPSSPLAVPVADSPAPTAASSAAAGAAVGPVQPAVQAPVLSPVLPSAGEQTVSPVPRRGAVPRSRNEAETLAGIFRQLRSGGDPAAVLRTLDGYDHRFPAGTLRGEARIARVEALTALGRAREALPLLEEIESTGDVLTRNVRIARAELWAENGRCARALVDFNLLVAAPVKDAVTARALFGRASCRLREGDRAAARDDLVRYLSLQPDPASAAAARRALDSLP